MVMMMVVGVDGGGDDDGGDDYGGDNGDSGCDDGVGDDGGSGDDDVGGGGVCDDGVGGGNDCGSDDDAGGGDIMHWCLVMMPLMVMFLVMMMMVVEAPLTEARARVGQWGYTPLYFCQTPPILPKYIFLNTGSCLDTVSDYLQ